MNAVDQDSPGVIAIPPFIYLGFLALGFLIDFFFPQRFIPAVFQYGVGIPLIVLSFSIIPFVLLQFRKAETNLDARKPTLAIIKQGPYCYSRNPAYLSLTLLYGGIGVIAGNIWALGLMIPLLMVMHYGVIIREEHYLEKKFGEEYLGYKKSVRRWL